MDLALKLTDVVKYYKQQKVLDGVSLQIPPGHFVGLVGENGAGKTSLIKSILNFSDIETGQIQIFDQDHRRSESRSKIAFLPERFQPPYFFRGEDFLRYMLKLYRQPYNSELLDQIMLILDLNSTVLKKPVRTLSKGMAQKLGMAAILMSNRQLFILDEPMSGLDPKARALLKRYLLDLRVQGKTLFFSTHLLEDVESLCDEIVILHAGRAKFIGSPDVCCEYYGVDNLEQAYISSIT